MKILSFCRVAKRLVDITQEGLLGSSCNLRQKCRAESIKQDVMMIALGYCGRRWRKTRSNAENHGFRNVAKRLVIITQKGQLGLSCNLQQSCRTWRVQQNAEDFIEIGTEGESGHGSKDCPLWVLTASLHLGSTRERHTLPSSNMQSR